MLADAARNTDAWASNARWAADSARAVGAVASAASRVAAAMAHRWEGAMVFEPIGSGVQQQVGSLMEHRVLAQVTALRVGDQFGDGQRAVHRVLAVLARRRLQQ